MNDPFGAMNRLWFGAFLLVCRSSLTGTNSLIVGWIYGTEGEHLGEKPIPLLLLLASRYYCASKLSSSDRPHRTLVVRRLLPAKTSYITVTLMKAEMYQSSSPHDLTLNDYTVSCDE